MRRRELLLSAMGLSGREGGEHPRSPAPFGRRRPIAEAAALLERASGVGAAVLHVRHGEEVFTQAFGEARGPDTVFLLASITKPMTAAAVMTLVEAGRLALDDRVAAHVPAFAGGDRGLVTVRHLLCHTSGLPDMLPDNLELRRRHAPLAAFLAGACEAPLRFKPGTDVGYQSMGFLLAAAIVERLAGRPLREHLHRALFAPLGMEATSLGLGGRRVEDTARCQVPDDTGGWNSPYWRDLGAPWGGAHGTAADLARLLRFFARPTAGPLRPESVATMLTVQTPLARRDRYGLGWRFGVGPRGASPRTFGHSGATGVLCWIDPARDLSLVLLTTLPAAESQAKVLDPVSELVSAAF